jgi:hypothetical protein
MSTNRHGEAGVAQVTKQSEESLREPEKSWDCVSAWVNCIRPAARTPLRAHRMPRAPACASQYAFFADVHGDAQRRACARFDHAIGPVRSAPPAT